MQVIINGTSLGKSLQGITINEKLSDDIDYATIIYNSNSATGFKPYLKATIIYNNLEKCFITYEDNSELTDSSNNVYTHTLQLVEMTKYLEKITLPAQSYTMQDFSLVDQVFKLLTNAEITRSSQTTRFWLTNRLTSLISYTKSYDFKFDNTTLRDALDEMLSIFNVRCYVSDLTYTNGEIASVEIDYKDLKPNNQNITNIPKITKDTYTTNADYLTDSFDIFGENASFETTRTIWHPSSYGYSSLKTNEATLSDKNAIIAVAYPIEELVKFEVLVDLNIQTFNQATNVTQTYELKNLALDISRYVVDKEVFDILTDLEKNDYLYYVKGSVVFSQNTYKDLFFTEQSFKNALENSAMDYAVENYETPDIEIRFATIQHPVMKVENILYRIQYKPYVNIHAKVSKTKYDKSLKGLSQYNNQQSKNIDIFRYGINSKNQVNQTGLIKREIQAIVNSESELLPLGVNYQNNILVAREYQLFPSHINVRYHFAESFTAINERLAIRREKRIYNIPLETFDRNILFKSYVMISDIEKLNKGFVNKRFLGIFTNSFVNGRSSTLRVSNVIAKTNASANNYALPLNQYSFANALCFNFRFQDNYSAGMSISNQVLGGKKVVQNPYVYNDGSFSKISIMLSSMSIPLLTPDSTRTRLLNIGRSYPKINLSDLATDHNLSENIEYQVFKDRLETIVGTVQVDFRPTISNESKFILGTHFLFRNLIIDNYTVSSLNIFASTETYDVNENVIVKGDLIPFASVNNRDQLGEISNFIEVAGLPTNPNYKSWAIADDNNNLLFACNDYNLRKIWFYSTWEVE